MVKVCNITGTTAFLTAGLFIVFLACCNSTGLQEGSEEFRNSPHTIENRDSLYINFTHRAWGEANWWTYSNYSKMYEMTNNQVDYFVSVAFYSPDRKKIIAWIGQKFPNSRSIKKYSEISSNNRICPRGPDTVYTMSAIIGYRENAGSIWKLYPLELQSVVCSSTKEEAERILTAYYFHYMKSHEMFRVQQDGPRRGYKELQAYGYNIQDKGFWDKCWIWGKDTLGSHSLYTFQILGYDDQGRMCTKESADPWDPPVVDYPKSITDLYKNP